MSLLCQPGHAVHGQSEHTKARCAVNVQRYLWVEAATLHSSCKSQCTVDVQQGRGQGERTRSKPANLTQAVRAWHLMERNTAHTRSWWTLRERLAAVQVIKLSETGGTENA